MEFVSQLLETWQINHRLNLYFLDNLAPENLLVKGAKSKSVGAHFAHQHNVRLMWLKASAPDLTGDLSKIETEHDLEELKLGHLGSTPAIAKLLIAGFETGKIKNFKPNPPAFLGYLLAHEAFHRSQAELILRQAGFPLSDKVAYGLWEWGTR